ncbi:kinase-like protein [Sistotremastrum niveocremeum HHB9708]|uniref:Kinase-like protein n=2 Tax=Sistotremastraceae TaxID=3402574 RepID=A0A164XPX2_9AGAM|nr:kinase-like protein [Sistotremastrum niveocremeum HHB9708]KZT44481.1 kinase-like protein [Sistotremastrum suecicum HHB10207 ss-3]
MSSTISTNAAAITQKFIGAVDDEWQMYSDHPEDYTLGPPIGFGASSTVYIAEYRPKSSRAAPTPCALKVLDLDALPPKTLWLLRRETQLMSLSKHPNVLRVRGTWMEGYKLYIAMRLMKSGSVADVMRYGFPGGVEEEVAKCILKQALEGLNYLHVNGFIHRDLKAANLLIDEDGTVLLGDLGVAVSLSDEEEPPAQSNPKKTMNFDGTLVNPKVGTRDRKTRQRGKRHSFVGTPCWMAPEVISQKQYDLKADIWSFGITALELTQGRAPRSREPPHKVLMRTLNDAPPTLDRDGGPFKYSKSFQDMIEMCLAKDPSKRPTAHELLQTPFFKTAKRKSFLVGTILKGLPPLVNRQERRRQPTMPATQTTDSWDFSQSQTTLTSQLRSSSIPHITSTTGKTASPDLISEPIFDDEEVAQLSLSPLSSTIRRSTFRIVASPMDDDPVSDPEDAFSRTADGFLSPPMKDTRPPLSPALSNLSSLSSSTTSSRTGSVPSSITGSPHSGGFWKKLKSRKGHSG